MPTALTYTYVTEEDIQALLSVEGATARVDDTPDNAQSATEAEYVTKSRHWATDRVNFYCLQRYAAQHLATSWVVNQWATICAARWLSQRRGNPPPGTFEKLYDEAVEDMKLVHAGVYEIPGIGTREVLWPAWSNVRIDQLYILRKIRVERPISERSQTQFRQNKDWLAERVWEP